MFSSPRRRVAAPLMEVERACPRASGWAVERVRGPHLLRKLYNFGAIARRLVFAKHGHAQERKMIKTDEPATRTNLWTEQYAVEKHWNPAGSMNKDQQFGAVASFAEEGFGSAISGTIREAARQTAKALLARHGLVHMTTQEDGVPEPVHHNLATPALEAVPSQM
jgi:hypothetical protein